MTTIETNTLDTQQIASVKSLQALCFLLEGLKNEPCLSNEMNTDTTIPCFFLQYEGNMLVGILTAFFPTDVEVEINGFVHPDYRKRGIFSSLLTKAIDTYKPLSFLQLLFQVENSSESGKAYMTRRSAHIDRSEYRLTLSKESWQEARHSPPRRGSLVEATGENLQRFINAATSLLKEEAGFIQKMLHNPERKGYLYLYEDNPIGVLQKCEEHEELTMLYGIAIDEQYRNQGHGKTMLTLALDSFFTSCDFLSLEVDSQNPGAFELYGHLGFKIDFKVDYHSLILSSL